TLALLCAFCGFQAEHPLVLQLKQRRSFKPRFLVWGSIYGGIASAIALYLWLIQSELTSPLSWIYLSAIAALVVDAISVFHREQKSVLNELITFAAVCLSAPFAYVATSEHVSLLVMGLWILNTLFFSSAIFTVKLRKVKTATKFQTSLFSMGKHLRWYSLGDRPLSLADSIRTHIATFMDLFECDRCSRG
ncbi:MAG TPA: YwiC-like family protein, partial [Crinalium sp.]